MSVVRRLLLDLYKRIVRLVLTQLIIETLLVQSLTSDLMQLSPVTLLPRVLLLHC